VNGEGTFEAVHGWRWNFISTIKSHHKWQVTVYYTS